MNTIVKPLIMRNILNPIKYKRYMVFGYNDYYPRGGTDDLIAEAETFEDLCALFSFRKKQLICDSVGFETFQILDLVERAEFDIDEFKNLLKSKP